MRKYPSSSCEVLEGPDECCNFNYDLRSDMHNWIQNFLYSERVTNPRISLPLNRIIIITTTTLSWWKRLAFANRVSLPLARQEHSEYEHNLWIRRYCNKGTGRE